MLLIVRQEVLLDYRPVDLLGLESVYKSSWRRVHKLHVACLVLVAIVNDLVDVLEACVLVRAGEVVAPEDHGVRLAELCFHHILDIALQAAASAIEVKAKVTFVCDDVVDLVMVSGEARRCPVIVEENMRQNLFLSGWFPKKGRLPFLLKLLPLMTIHPREEQSFKSKICEKSSIGLRVAESIDHPSYLWSYPKLFVQE